jgi:dynein heavy chain
MYAFFEYMRAITNKLNIEVESLDVLRYVMSILKEVREKESSIELDVGPIMDMYTMLEHYLPGGVFDSEELEQKASIMLVWGKLVDHAESVAHSLSAVQGTYKKQLIWDIREFGMDIRGFRRDFEENGPMTIGIRPAQAVEKLKKFKDELMLRERKMEMNRGGEELFALRPTPFHEVTKTRKEINLIDQLYSLWADVDSSFTGWSAILWSEMAEQVSVMSETVNGYDSRCKRLPKKLREWPAFNEISSKIMDLQTLSPLLSELSKPSIKVRYLTLTNRIFKALITFLHSLNY